VTSDARSASSGAAARTWNITMFRLTAEPSPNPPRSDFSGPSEHHVFRKAEERTFSR
jgi:hypothetical protein